MLGRIFSAVAGQSIARTLGGSAAGPVGAVLGAAIPTVLPWAARRLGPVGMVAAAVGSYVVARAMASRETPASDAIIDGKAVKEAGAAKAADRRPAARKARPPLA